VSNLIQFCYFATIFVLGQLITHDRPKLASYKLSHYITLELFRVACTRPGPDHPWGWWGWSLRARTPIGPGPPGTTKIYKVGPLWAPKFLERKFAVFYFFLCCRG